ncbi:hypothetical protein ACTI_59720 [Actinoplanes sp. OR16]|uniref:DUF4229 domain-containing protein n=1 Tax=Actinoplanes sp. OR16 TaxID=946334 RepID=UPI000F6DAE62|nr:DUF4229 domain-containing protein [Actinoplanes sp. OR16]BBH69287.1 hypothetical protein ACTI_59720 [Actinoplanes sp. OR16]
MFANPVLRLLLGRLAIFMAALGILTLLPFGLDPLLRFVIAFFISMIASVFLLKRTREQVGEQVVTSVEKRQARKQASRGR